MEQEHEQARTSEAQQGNEPLTRPHAPSTAREQTVLIDLSPQWVRRPRDLVSAALALVSIIVVMLLAIYAQSTMTAVATDAAAGTSGILQTILFVPFTLIEGLISFFLPAVVMIDLIMRRRWRALTTALVAVALSVIASSILLWVFTKYFPASPLTGELSESLADTSFLNLLPYVSVLSALLAVTGGHKQSKVTSIGWPLLLFVVVLSVLQGNQTLPGALITVLIGVLFGELSRYVIGAEPERALGIDVVKIARRAGIDAREIVRIDGDIPLAELQAWRITTAEPLGYTDRAGREALRELLARAEDFRVPGLSREETQEMLADGEDSITLAHGIDPARRAVALRKNFHPPLGTEAARNYLIVATDGSVYHGAMLDADEQIVGMLATIWDRLRLLTATRRAERSIGEEAERIVLMELAARAAGLMPDQEVLVGNNEDSYLLAFTLTGAMPLSDDRHGELSDLMLDGFWAMLTAAHSRGICHGSITTECTAIADGRLELTHWESGSIAANDVARRADMAQAVAMLATVVGPERAVQSAQRCLEADVLISMAPMLQRAIIPHATMAALNDSKALQTLRDLLVGEFGEDIEVEPFQVHRFSPKTVFSVVLGLVAVYLLLGSINFADLKETVSHAQPLWLLAAFAFSMLTYLGAGMMLKNFTAEQISLRDATFVQLAASVVSLVAPAGIGHAALNLRYLQKQKVATPVAVATVSVVQVFQFVTTVIFLLVLALFTGDVGTLSIPSSSIIVAIGIVVALVAGVMFIRPVRHWVIEKAQPYVEQVWPRLVWLGTHPQRIAYGFGSALILTAGYIGAFAASLFAFDYSLPIVTLAITYLVSNSVGSVVPSPGGIGPVEAALTGGLTLAGVPYSVAFSAAIVYRVLTFWAPVPIGWVCLQFLQKKDIV